MATIRFECPLPHWLYKYRPFSTISVKEMKKLLVSKFHEGERSYMRTGVPRIVAKDDLPAAWLKWSKVRKARSWLAHRQSPWLMIRALVNHAGLSLLRSARKK
ncbi:hypothetical protein V6N13_134896 [Hibiscus sabdariffa]